MTMSSEQGDDVEVDNDDGDDVDDGCAYARSYGNVEDDTDDEWGDDDGDDSDDNVGDGDAEDVDCDHDVAVVYDVGGRYAYNDDDIGSVGDDGYDDGDDDDDDTDDVDGYMDNDDDGRDGG